MPEPTEWEIQRAFTIWFKGEKYTTGPKKGQWKVEPAKLPGVIAFHVPNGGARSGAFEGMRLKQIGVEPGVHDYLFLWGGLYGLEFKKRGGVLSPSQVRMHPLMLAAGMVASAVVDNLEDAKNFVRRHGLVNVDSKHNMK